MSDYALYRLPEKNEYHAIEGNAVEVNDIIGLDGRKGFVLAPFNIGGNNPLLIIEAEKSEVKEVPADSGRHTGLKILREDDHRDDYHKDFEKLHGYLEDETLNKIVLSRRLDITLDNSNGVDAKEVFFTACRMYPHQMIALVSTKKSGTWLMATPEVLLEKEAGEHSWKTMALAGTMTTPGPWSEKNQKEQYLVARYIFYCIGRYAYLFRNSSPYTASAAKLYHIRTDFSFDVSYDSDAFKVLNDLHPTPAVCGLPKDTAFDIILKDESIDRKYYSGFSGPLGIDGETHLFVSLRCMQINGEECHLYAGGGLLEESVEENEWKETELKLKTMRDVLR